MREEGLAAPFEVALDLLKQRSQRGQERIHRLSGGRLCRTAGHDVLVREAAGMLSRFEREYLVHYAQHDFTGAGQIVDLGCLLGSSTIPLVCGLSRNRRSQSRARQVFAYDLFRWEPYMEPLVAGSSAAGRYRQGDSFTDEFLRRTAPWGDRVVMRPGDLSLLPWEDGPIELLFVDAMKSWDLANAIFQRFFTQLIPGVSVVVHQDFSHHQTPWIHLLMHRLRDALVPTRYLPFSSLVFECRSRPDPQVLTRTWSREDFDDAEIDAAFAWSRACVPPDGVAGVLAAEGMLHVHAGDLDRAREHRDRIRPLDGVATDASFQSFEQKLEARLEARAAS